MFKIQYLSQKNRLIKDYKDIITSYNSSLSTKWEVFQNQYFKHNNKLYNIDFDSLITNEFNDLVDIYLEFIEKVPYYDYRNNKGKKANKLIEDAQECFPYTEYSSLIAKFINENLSIHTCPYCDASYIYFFENKYSINYKRTFDIDHFIPKSECPILALSIFNFVPSCKICNSSVIKGSKSLLDLYDIRMLSKQKQREILCKLSPTCDNYRFIENTKMKILPHLNESSEWYPPLSSFEERDFFQINFFYSDIDYKREVTAFQYEERYNSGNALAEATNYLDLKRRYNQTNIKYIKNILCNNGFYISEDEIYEDIFHTKFNKNHESIYLKMKNDILE